MNDTVTALCPNTALFLDFDGTLAPLQDTPDAVLLPSDGAGILGALRTRLGGALFIISGRDIRDLSARTPLDQWRIGGHGMDVCAPGEMPARQTGHAPAQLCDELALLIKKFPGARLEDKGVVLALHYRAVPEAGDALAAAAAIIVARADGYVMQHGKMVIEAKPATANKGAALRSMMLRPAFAGRRPVMVGDDVTDEDAMAEALRLGGEAVKVGDGATLARTRLDDPAAVWRWLKASAGI